MQRALGRKVSLTRLRSRARVCKSYKKRVLGLYSYSNVAMLTRRRRHSSLAKVMRSSGSLSPASDDSARNEVFSFQLSALSFPSQARQAKLEIASARVVETESQFNAVLVVNKTLVLRFPRNAQAATALTREVAVLRRLQGRLPLPVPNPTLMGQDAATRRIGWMGYALLPGGPLWNEELEALGEADQRQLALQLAGFLHTLHTLPPDEVAPEFPTRDETQFWARLFWKRKA